MTALRGLPAATAFAAGVARYGRWRVPLEAHRLKWWLIASNSARTSRSHVSKE